MANVELTNEEISVISNSDFLLTKNKAIQKLQQAFGSIAIQYQKTTQNGISEWQQYCVTSPKISKGEHFEGLPYLMLDYPRAFSNTETFAIRSFFWWGNYFSISLLLSGRCQQLLVPRLLANSLLDDWHIDTSSTPWNHRWDTETSPRLSNISNANISMQADFFKISTQIPLSQWQDMEQFFITNFEQLWSAINYPNV